MEFFQYLIRSNPMLFVHFLLGVKADYKLAQQRMIERRMLEKVQYDLMLQRLAVGAEKVNIPRQQQPPPGRPKGDDDDSDDDSDFDDDDLREAEAVCILWGFLFLFCVFYFNKVVGMCSHLYLFRSRNCEFR